MRRIIQTLICILVGLPILAQSSAVILKERVTYTDNSGKITKRVYQKVKVMKPVAYRSFGEWFYTFNPEAEDVTILTSKTIQPDGTVVVTPQNGILLQSPSATQDAPDFSFLREMMVSHTGLEPDSIIEFEYEIKDKKAFRTGILEQMSSYFPIEEKTVVFEHFNLENVVVNGSVQVSDNTFTLKKSSPVILNHRFSNQENHSYLYVPLTDYFNVIKGLVHDKKNLEGVSELIRYLGLSKYTPQVEVAVACSEFINNRLTTIHLTLEDSGYFMRTVNDIYTSGYASEYEKAFLALSVLNELNIQAEMFIATGSKKSLHHPQYAVFSDSLPVFDGRVNPWESSFSVTSGKWIKKPAALGQISINLEESEAGQFSGKAYVSTSNPSQHSVNSLLPFSKVKVEKSTTLAKSLDMESSSHDVTLEVKDGLIHLKNIFKSGFQIDQLMKAIQSSSSVHLSADRSVIVKINMKCNSNTNFITSGNYHITNALGHSMWTWSKTGRSLALFGSLALKKGTVQKEQFTQLAAIIGPLLMPQNFEIILD